MSDTLTLRVRQGPRKERVACGLWSVPGDDARLAMQTGNPLLAYAEWVLRQSTDSTDRLRRQTHLAEVKQWLREHPTATWEAE